MNKTTENHFKQIKSHDDEDFILIHCDNRKWTKQEKEKGGKRKAKEQDKYRRNSCKLQTAC